MMVTRTRTTTSRTCASGRSTRSASSRSENGGAAHVWSGQQHHRGRLGVGSIWSAGPGRKETHGERCLRNEKHEEGRPDSLRVARPKVRGDRAHEVDDQADGRRHAQDRPPDAKHQARCPRELAGSQDRKVLQGNTYRLVDYPDLAGIAANLAKGGKGGHRR